MTNRTILIALVVSAIAFTLPDQDADKRAGKRTLATLIGAKHTAELAVFLSVIAQFLLLLVHPHGFILSPLNLPFLPLLLSFLLLPKLKPSNDTTAALESTRKYTLVFIALTLTSGTFYVLGIFLSTKV